MVHMTDMTRCFFREHLNLVSIILMIKQLYEIEPRIDKKKAFGNYFISFTGKVITNRFPEVSKQREAPH